MREKFERQLVELNNTMIDMGNKVIESINGSIDALINRDIEKAKIIMGNDNEIDDLQKASENICFNLLVEQQHVAKDLL